MELPTGSQDSSAPSLAGLIQKNYTPGNGVNGNAPTFQNSLRINIDDPVAPPPLPVVQPQPIGYMQVPAQPRMTAPQPQLSAPAQQYANAFQNNGQPMDNGTWMQRNLQMVQAEQALKAQQQQLQPQYEQLWRDSQRSQALQMLQNTQGTSEQNSLGALWAASVLGNQNNGMMNGGQYGMTAGNQSLAQLQELQRQGINVPPQLLQAAYDQDYLWNMDGDTTSLKGIGSLQYKSMGVAGGTYTGNNSTSAYGASAFDDNGNWNKNSGANYFEYDNTGYNKQQLDEIKRGWSNDKRYSKDPVGSYGGPAGDGINVKQYGDPSKLLPSPQPVPMGVQAKPYAGPDYSGWMPDGVDTIIDPGKGKGSNYNSQDYQDFYNKKGYQYNPIQGNPNKGITGGFGSNTYPAYPALSQWADAPAVESSAKPIPGKGFSPINPNFDIFAEQNFMNLRPDPASSSFDRWETNPFTAGQIGGLMGVSKKGGKK